MNFLNTIQSNRGIDVHIDETELYVVVPSGGGNFIKVNFDRNTGQEGDKQSFHLSGDYEMKQLRNILRDKYPSDIKDTLRSEFDEYERQRIAKMLESQKGGVSIGQEVYFTATQGEPRTVASEYFSSSNPYNGVVYRTTTDCNYNSYRTEYTAIFDSEDDSE